MRILIADDDATTRVLLRSLLIRWGFEVSEAPDGEEAWRRLTSSHAPPLALVDWMMPGLDGVDLCRRLRDAGYRGLPYVVLLTSKKESAAVAAGLNAGADDFVGKPFDPEELRARLAAGWRVITLQQQLREANERLEKRGSESASHIGQLLRQNQEIITRLGHDLRTPLTPLTALLPLLSAEENDPARQRSLQVCIDQVKHIRRLAERVFDLGRLNSATSPLTTHPVSLAAIVEAALETRADNSQIAPRVSVRIGPEVKVRAEATWLRRVFEDLLDNALKFAPSDGVVIVTAECRPQEVLVSVSDRGRGLLAEQLESVFDPFYTGDPARQDRRSNGLGLTLCRWIVERHGGRIWAESAGPGSGTSIRFTLPLVDQPASLARPGAGDEQGWSSNPVAADALPAAVPSVTPTRRTLSAAEL